MIYLAAPYSDKDPLITGERIANFCQVDAVLMSKGLHTISPLSKHFILAYGKLPGSWDGKITASP